MIKLSRLTLSAALLTAFALPAMAGVPTQHRAPAKAHATHGAVRHIAATGPDAVRTPAVGSAPIAAPAAPRSATATPPAGVAAGTPSSSTTATAPTAAVKPTVKTN